MNTNCYVEKLDGSSNNPNAKIFGLIEIPVKANQEIRAITVGGINSSKPVHLKITDGTFYEYSSGTPLGSETDVYGNTATKYIANTDCSILISKYDIAYIRVNAVNNMTGDFYTNDFNPFCLNFKDFIYDSDMTRFEVSPVVGNLMDIAALTSITTLKVQLTDSSVQDGKVPTGDLFSFAQAQISNHRTVPFTIATNNRFPFKGVKIAAGTKGNYDLHVVDASHLYVMPASGTQSNVVYEYGYTDEEIATNTASGGIWAGKTVTKVS